jgi:hypothetical protein
MAAPIAALLAIGEPEARRGCTRWAGAAAKDGGGRLFCLREEWPRLRGQGKKAGLRHCGPGPKAAPSPPDPPVERP